MTKNELDAYFAILGDLAQTETYLSNVDTRSHFIIKSKELESLMTAQPGKASKIKKDLDTLIKLRGPLAVTQKALKNLVEMKEASIKSFNDISALYTEHKKQFDAVENFDKEVSSFRGALDEPMAPRLSRGHAYAMYQAKEKGRNRIEFAVKR